MSQISKKFTSYTKEAATRGRKDEATTTWLKINPGTNIYRFLPPLVGFDEPWVTFHQHFLKLDGQEKPLVVNCPRRMNNDRCPICEYGDKLKATGRPSDEQKAKQFWASARNAAFVIDRDDPEKGIQILGFGVTIKDRLRYFREKRNKDITHLVDGYDVIVERTGTGFDTKYQVDLGDPGPTIEDLSKLDEMAEGLMDLNDLAVVLPYEVIRERFMSAMGMGAPAPAARSIASGVQDGVLEPDVGSDDPY